jgi:hypothetical protein
VGVPYGCSIGRCGECKIEIVTGSVHYRQPPPSAMTQRDVASGRALACQAIPATDCSICVRLQEEYVPAAPSRLSHCAPAGGRTHCAGDDAVVFFRARAGPPAMVEAVLMTLNADVGIPLERIFYDRFFY